jgi:hypothetical protein
MSSMNFHGSFADLQPVRDLLVHRPGDERHDLALAPGQRFI